MKQQRELMMKMIKMLSILLLLVGCTQDQQNQLSRKAVEFLDGNYQVTYANGSTMKTWTITNGKVTSTDKGYYFFWDNQKHYVQVPIENTFIEEIGS
jgi:major membrane immunogen (membrane-anchored lipoprotein)